FLLTVILIGEIMGSVFSVLYPEPIDRTSRYSGGTAAGALIVPTLQVAIMGVFLAYNALAFQLLTPIAAAIPLIAVPVVLWIVRITLLPWWIRRSLIDRSEILLRGLSALPS
ncbi:MAG: hypothetical protein P8Y94_16955, partial [Acidobacteriota bacterium]